jgi:hypothetical protein
MRAAKNRYHSSIRRAKRSHWREYINELPRASIWQAAKYPLDPKSLSTPSRIPDLIAPDGSVATTPAEKTKVLREKFFPQTRPDPDEPLLEPLPGPSFTIEDIYRAIAKLAPWKAPDPSGIPNIAIKSANVVLAPILLNVLGAGLRIGHFPSLLWIFLTITLRKPGKSEMAFRVRGEIWAALPEPIWRPPGTMHR